MASATVLRQPVVDLYAQYSVTLVECPINVQLVGLNTGIGTSCVDR